MAEATEPILASSTLHTVLQRYPRLLNLLVELGPAFGKLRNPVLRRVQTRLVTVGQAAQIAGLEPAALVQRLNAAAGLAGPGAPLANGPAGQPAPAGPSFEAAPVAVELDVRPLLARGEEPFGAIMAAAKTVPVGQALQLRVGFEPVPLYDILARQGFAHIAREDSPDDWEITFRRQGARGEDRRAVVEAATAPVPSAGEAVTEPVAAAPSESPDAIVRIDVSELVPPEPMVRILEALEQLAPGQTLLVEHVRRPIYLYPRLDALGCRHETRELSPGRVELRIRKPDATAEGDQ